jgi:hypothetical protein
MLIPLQPSVDKPVQVYLPKVGGVFFSCSIVKLVKVQTTS